ncbi:MAG: ferredoxin [Desulfuromonadales bacterium]|nr:ferredoxin [Desulfuromonadales bacterium]
MSRIPAVDPDCCIGCEVCTQTCPEVFRMEDSHDGQAHEKAIVHNPTGASELKIETAMDNCPAACIYWA